MRLLNESPPSQQSVPTTLDYEPPRRMPLAWKRELLLGIAAILCVALGVGFTSFGILMGSWRYREDEATLIAVGLTLLVLGVGCVALIVWFRRSER